MKKTKQVLAAVKKFAVKNYDNCSPHGFYQPRKFKLNNTKKEVTK